jgi:hypothetical protein
MPQKSENAPEGGCATNQARLLKPTVRSVVDEVRALEFIRRMRGESQPCLLRCSDELHYVVKFKNNPQGKRILANELLGALLARQLSLPIAEPAVVIVPRAIVQFSTEMVVKIGLRRTQMESGCCFGSRYPISSEKTPWGLPKLETVFDFLPREQLLGLNNAADIAGMLVFDKWTCNTDGRQAIFVLDKESGAYRAIMIDDGLCFNGAMWNFPDAPLRSISLLQSAFDAIPSFSFFETWIERLEKRIDRAALAAIGSEIPPMWYYYDHDALHRLLDRLDRRRGIVIDLVWSAWKVIRGGFRDRTFSRDCAIPLGESHAFVSSNYWTERDAS